MRLAYLCADRGVPLDGVKGASIHVRAVADALAARGHELTMLAARPARRNGGSRWPMVDVGYDRSLKELKRAMVAAGEDSQMAREEASGGSCGVTSGAGRGPLYNARSSVRDSPCCRSGTGRSGRPARR